MHTRFSWYKCGRISAAFSLLELLVVIALVTLLMTLSLPAWHSLLQRYYFTLRYDRLWHTLYLTKTQAILHKQLLELCGSQDGQRCDGDWHSHWLIYAVRQQRVLHQITLPPLKQFTITWRGNFNYRTGIYFDKLGETRGQQGRFVLRLGKTQQREIVITRVGRLRRHALLEMDS